MLMILALCLLLGSVFVFCVKRSRESLLLTALCLSLTVYFLGILVYIAKKGGYSPEILRFLFCSNQIRTWVQYRFITFNQLGYIIAVGRFLFPPFLLAIAMHYSMLSCIRQRPLVRRLIWILPGLTLLIYWPGIYRWIIALSPRSFYLLRFPFSGGSSAGSLYAWRRCPLCFCCIADRTRDRYIASIAIITSGPGALDTSSSIPA